ncbi:major facilitator superfamily domain-containing protein [Aspergillus tetrazonus]
MEIVTHVQEKPSLAEAEDAKKRVITEVSHYEALSEEEKALDKRVNLKLDFILLLILAIGLILLGIDKTNVGFVATSTFIEDANLHPNDISNSLSLFSATYVPLQPISAMIGRYIGHKWWVCTLMIVWGSICIAHVGVNSTPTFLALRLLLGVGESGFTPTAYYYMSLFYPKFSLGFRMGLFSGMYSVAGAFAGLLAYGLLHLESSVLHGWQTVFLFEGALTVFERAHAMKRMERDDAQAGEAAEGESKITVRDVLDVLKDWKKLLIVVFNILSVLVRMGYAGVKATLMAVPPFTAGTAGLIAIVYSSDHLKERSLHIVFGMCIGLIGCVVIATSHNEKLRHGFAHVCLAGVFAGGPLVAVWLASNTPNKALIWLVLLRDNCSRGVYMWENRRRRAIMRAWEGGDFVEGQNRRGDQKVTWVYAY